MSSPLCDDSCILEVLDSFRDHTVKLNLSPGDIRESRVVVFDKGLKTVACNPGFIKLFKAPYQEETFLRGKDLSFYAPDFEEEGELRLFRKVAQNGGAFGIRDYKIVIPEVRGPLYVQICVFSYHGLVYTVSIDANDHGKQGGKSAQDRNRRNQENCCPLRNRLDKLLYMTAGRCSPEQYDFYRDLEQTVFPMLDLLRISNLNRRQTQILDAITDSLNFICQRPQFGKLINSKGDFTRREMQIVNLIFQGKTTKEISDILVLSPRTVDFHRANIRKKLGIKNLGGDLQRWLAAMEREEEPLSAAGSAETNGDLAGRI